MDLWNVVLGFYFDNSCLNIHFLAYVKNLLIYTGCSCTCGTLNNDQLTPFPGY